MPKYYEYLELFREKTFFDFLEQMLKFSSIIQSEGEALLIEEFGRTHKIYFSILEAIASSRNTLVEIANSISQKPTTITKYLKSLEEYFNLISREKPVLEKKTKKSRYIISDYFLNFWFTFIRKNQALVETENYEALTRKIETNFPNYFGRIFERLAKDILVELNQKGVVEFDEIGPQWADLLPVVKGEGSNELTPANGRFGLWAHHLLPSPVSIQPTGRVFGPLPLPQSGSGLSF